MPLWDKPSRAMEAPAASWQVPHTLEAISVEQVRTASLSFGRRKGLGWDNFHPRLLNELSDPLVERFTAILNQFEGSAEVPDLWTTMMV